MMLTTTQPPPMTMLIKLNYLIILIPNHEGSV